jgi:4-oxalocrotonate tautomerase
MLEGRTPEKKADLIRTLTDAAEQAIGARRESVRVILREVPREHFGVAGEVIGPGSGSKYGAPS